MNFMSKLEFSKTIKPDHSMGRRNGLLGTTLSRLCLKGVGAKWWKNKGILCDSQKAIRFYMTVSYGGAFELIQAVWINR